MDTLTHREIMKVWHRIQGERSADLIREGGPMGAMAQAAQFFELVWVDAAKWGHPKIGDIELTEGPPAMVKHLLEQERLRKNKKVYRRKIKDRQEKARDDGARADLTFEQAIGGTVDWDHVAELAVRPGT